MVPKFQKRDRQRSRENTEKGNSRFPEEQVETADLYKFVLSKMITTNQ